MRLTLRTLLAYLDEILDPADAQELADKISESDYATGLVHRIRNSMGRLRLTSPKVLGKGLAADPNTVADYLDNVLPVERVPEFEKICLESDMHLSEVASCHQILTLVLGEAAEVDDTLRQRMYGLASHADSAPPATNAPRRVAAGEAMRHRIDPAIHGPSRLDATNAAQSSVVTSPAASDEWSPHSSESPTRQRTSLMPIVATLLLGFVGTTLLLLGTGWLSGGPGSVSTSVPQNDKDAIDGGPSAVTNFMASPTPPGAATPQTSTDAIDAASAWQPPAEPAADSPADSPQIGGSGRSPELPPPVAANAGESLVPPPLLATPSTPDSSGVSTDLSRSAVPTTSPEAVDAGASSDGTFPPKPALDDDSLMSSVIGGSPDAEGGDQPARRGRDLGGAEGGFVGPPMEKEAIVAPVARDVGRNVGEGQVLAVWDDSQENWMRMPVPGRMEVGHWFRGLPVYRPQLLFANGMRMTIDDGMDFHVLEPAHDGTLRLEVTWGRALVEGMGEGVARMEWQIGGHPFTLTLVDAESEFAIAVERVTSPGSDPADAPRHSVIQVWALSGGIQIEPAGGEIARLQAGETWTSHDLRPLGVAKFDQVPTWIAGSTIREIDRAALNELEPALAEDRSLTVALLEASESPRPDLKSLSARCLAALDRFEPAIDALGDRKQFPHWHKHCEQLRHAIQRSNQVSERVSMTLQRSTGPDASRLYRMLWGYSPQQLSDAGASELVNGLEDDSLEIRVVAFETLKQITEMHLYFRPEQPEARRRTALKNWQRRLESKDITYRTPPLLFEQDVP